MQNHPNVQAVRDALDAAGARTADGTPPEIVILDEAVHTAPAAAQALGVEVGQIANSLIFDADGAPLLVLTSGAHRVDTGKVAALVGAAAVRRASPGFVLAATGQEVGGVAPVGHPTRLRTVVDVDLAAHPLLWVGGGDHHTMVAVTYGDLVRVTGGEAAAIS